MNVHEKHTDSRKTPQGIRCLSWLQPITFLGPGLACLRKQLLRSPLVETELKTRQGPAVHRVAETNEVQAEQTTCAGLHSWPTTSHAMQRLKLFLAFAANITHKKMHDNSWMATEYGLQRLAKSFSLSEQICCDAVSSQCTNCKCGFLVSILYAAKWLESTIYLNRLKGMPASRRPPSSHRSFWRSAVNLSDMPSLAA